MLFFSANKIEVPSQLQVFVPLSLTQSELVSVMAGKSFSSRVRQRCRGKKFFSLSLSGQLCVVMGILDEMYGCVCLFMLC